MPYYREYFRNNDGFSSVGSATFPLVFEDAYMMGFRAHAHRDAYWSSEILDSAADPYAYFLEISSRTKYAQRLAERNLEPQGGPDKGHAWELYRYSLDGSWFSTSKRTSAGITFLVNPVMSPYTNGPGMPGFLRAQPTGVGSLPTFAQQAYQRSAPTSVMFDAAQFLGELREGLPHLVPELLKGSAKVFRKAGSDYLNVEFGWKPFLNDLINMGRALSSATTLLSQGGTRVHRRYGTPTQYASVEDRGVNTPLTTLTGMHGLRSMGSFGLPTAVGNGIAPNGDYYALRTTEVTRWFEGEFTSFMPLGFDPSSYLDKLNALVNVKMTPSVLWELAPWSWLVDWHLRIGDTIAANETAANDLLVMHYGYAMEKTVVSDLLSLSNLTPPPVPPATLGWYGLPKTASWVSRTETKRRIRANPYGFRTGGTAALQPGQLAILGALGLTRLK